MPDTRYALRNGDKTTTNGILIATGESMTHHGVKVGVEGDHATCPVCSVGGPVMNDCYPAFNVHGKQILVSGARVYCKCQKPPLVIHSQTNFTIEVNRSSRGIVNTESASYASLASTDSAEIIEQYFEITGEDGQPVEDYRYDLFASGAQVARNTKMNGGRTISVDGGHDLHIVMWLDKNGQECA
ncbi:MULTISPECIES: PAAR domain-containing protein [Cupriavidus]|jgi:uncharacterized Zn-binding protein involved in type VI secretion|uniref:PAAR domain-containing protein n=1 Tax=Cupriavidus metallidurans TaxID=119219 RepID=A0A2L0X1L8_9BURK|nr:MULTISPECIES: PAAR domain-containing protein [Cupriavidus]AVA33988.1 PAAR domain-containing protein [Cupriavidus metallidurans]KWR86893.1 hypothetical protein RN01_01300 [Cupriavidus sp. SHE]QBP12768.1 PAAR domain-containing protein [Cupriavidus metallidurans]QWC90554.1 PAAR domain-containing protein [Cupriavidus metallidurans]